MKSIRNIPNDNSDEQTILIRAAVLSPAGPPALRAIDHNGSVNNDNPANDLISTEKGSPRESLINNVRVLVFDANGKQVKSELYVHAQSSITNAKHFIDHPHPSNQAIELETQLPVGTFSIYLIANEPISTTETDPYRLTSLNRKSQLYDDSNTYSRIFRPLAFRNKEELETTAAMGFIGMPMIGHVDDVIVHRPTPTVGTQPNPLLINIDMTRNIAKVELKLTNIKTPASTDSNGKVTPAVVYQAAQNTEVISVNIINCPIQYTVFENPIVADRKPTSYWKTTATGSHAPIYASLSPAFTTKSAGEAFTYEANCYMGTRWGVTSFIPDTLTKEGSDAPSMIEIRTKKLNKFYRYLIPIRKRNPASSTISYNIEPNHIYRLNVILSGVQIIHFQGEWIEEDPIEISTDHIDWN